MKIRKIKKEFKKTLRPIRKYKSFKIAKRSHRLHKTTDLNTLDYLQPIWLGKTYLPLFFSIETGKKYYKATDLFGQKRLVKIK